MSEGGAGTPRRARLAASPPVGRGTAHARLRPVVSPVPPPCLSDADSEVLPPLPRSCCSPPVPSGPREPCTVPHVVQKMGRNPGNGPKGAFF